MGIHVSGGGGSGGGSSLPGANIETAVTLSATPFASTVLSLDTTGAAFVWWLNDLTINGAKDGLIVGRRGRYIISVASPVDQLATAWNTVALWAEVVAQAPALANHGTVVVPPLSLSSGDHPTVSYFTFAELDAGWVIQFKADQAATSPTEPVNIIDAYCTVQYVGSATAF